MLRSLTAALLLFAALIVPAFARECMTQRQFDRTVHKVKVGHHCWRALEAPRRTPKVAQVVAPAEIEPQAATDVPTPEPYAIGRDWTPDPAIVHPAWHVTGAWPADAAAAPGKATLGTRVAIAGGMLGFMCAVAGAALIAGRRHQVRVRDCEPIDPALIPVVIGGGVQVRRA